MIPAPRFRGVRDVSSLPDVTVGPRSLTWWGTLGFMTIEASTLIVCAAAYLYLRKNFDAWPPRGTPLPSLGLPVTELIVMAASVAAMYYAARAARRLDLGATRTALIIAVLIKVPILILRWYDFKALNTRWNSDAYGSIAWITVGTHATLLILDFFEDIGLLFIMYATRPQAKYVADVTEDAMYWLFTVGSWYLLFILLYLSPRWM